jgi:hypothetical protein
MSAHLSGAGWIMEVLAASALTLAAAYWLLGSQEPSPRGEGSFERPFTGKGF